MRKFINNRRPIFVFFTKGLLNCLKVYLVQMKSVCGGGDERDGGGRRILMKGMRLEVR